MSRPPSFPQGTPSLAEVLIERTFAKPPQPFVDGEFLEALERLDDDPAATVAISGPAAGAGAGAGAGADAGADPGPSADGGTDRGIDVRA
jgi:hypothetical protein